MNWAGLLQKSKQGRFLVVGDICLDRWCRYDPELSEGSRETGIPRLAVVKTSVSPGAGGTVANNLASLGAGRVAVLGAIGQDGFGFELERALTARRIDYSLLVASTDIQTFTYSKMINDQTDEEDRARVDFVNPRPLPSDVEDQLIANFSSVYQEFDAIVVSDQSETREGGVVTAALREVLADVAERNPEKAVIVDSRTRIHHFRNAICKPNEQEADAACRALFGARDYPRLRHALGDRPLVITRGEEGSLLVTIDGQKEIPAVHFGDTVDICGAGDSCAAGMAIALQAGAGIEAAVQLGGMVASITTTKRGTGCATPDEVLAIADALEGGRALR